MDPLEPLLIGAVARIAEGSLGEAGVQLWRSLRDLVGRSASGQKHESEVRDLPSPTQVGEIAAELARASEEDPDLRDGLHQWIGQVQHVEAQGSVSNSVSGTVDGHVVQARDIGSLKLE